VVVLFTADWAMPARNAEALLASSASAKSIKIRVIDIDKSPKTAKKYRVDAVPVFVLFAHGVEQARMLGVTSRDEMDHFVAQANAFRKP